jgi:2-polyprenyl-3-methyl-5-hydroxy-6-metoxy-1,4-benzoquinol methylase
MAEESLNPNAARDLNQQAWNKERYDAWTAAMGAPAEEAARLAADPRRAPRRLLPHLGDVAGKRICNLQGSHGRIAVSLALLGADVTVIDFAEENARYARELAESAGVSIGYHVSDSILADQLGLAPFDAVVMELGVLHYHQDIARFFAVCAALMKPGGALVLNEFHPIERKLFHYAGTGEGDYFRADLVIADVPNPTKDGRSIAQCAYRFWTLAEIVMAAIGAELTVRTLAEHPDWDNPRIPGTFTLVAEK